MSSSCLAMVNSAPSASYAELLQQVADTPLGPPLQRIVQRLAEARAANPAATAPLQQMAEALGLWRLQRSGEADVLLQLLEQRLGTTVQYWILRGMVARALPDGAGAALEAYRRALALDASRSDLHYNLANLQRESDPSSALQAYRRSLSLDQHQPNCWHNMGALLHLQEQSQAALPALQTSLLLDPTAPNVWCDLGNVLSALDRVPAAQRAYARAIALDRSHGASHVNLGAALVQDLKPQQALDVLRRGVELQKSSADSLWNLALAHLQLGEFAMGWQLYDARLQVDDCQIPPSPTAGPMPMGLQECPTRDQPPLVVWSEQGIGDALQFCRYLPLLEAAGVPFEFHCRPELLRLMSQWLGLNQRAVPETSIPNASDQRPQIPLLSLPRLFGTTLATIPSQLPYLTAPESAPPALRVPTPPGGLAVGLVWASHAGNRRMYGRKSIPLALVMPRLLDLIELDLIDLHCLQWGVDANQLQSWGECPRVTNWAPLCRDFADTAHVVNQLDLVISVDTAVAHLAAALGRPTWLLLPHAADFRWLQQREDSPWYPGVMRLFRQPRAGDWLGLVEQLHAALDALFLLDLGALAADKLRQ